ncbi:MAG: hypothetical protein ACYTDW_11905 [Planctomycetota bacterium]|jgi:hypothetical protein
MKKQLFWAVMVTALLVACLAMVNAPFGVNADKENVVASRPGGKRQPQAALTERLTGKSKSPHGEAKDGLAAFLLCHRAHFKVGQPIPLSYGIINVGSGLEWETNLEEAEKNAKLKTRIWWLGNNPELRYNYSWFEVTGPDGNNVPYRGSTGTLPNYTAAVVDKYSMVLYHRQIVGYHYPDLRGPLTSFPGLEKSFFDLSKLGTYKVRWGYSPWWKVGPWTGTLMSNEVEFEIVK